MKMMRLLLILFLAWTVSSANSAPPKEEPLKSGNEGFGPSNAVERYVCEQIQKGAEADIEKRFPKMVDRQLRGEFLFQLLSGQLVKLPPPFANIRITGGTVKGDVGVARLSVKNGLIFEKCRFINDVQCEQADFSGGLIFEKCTFRQFLGPYVQTGRQLTFSGCKFEKFLDLTGAKCDGDVVITDCEFAADSKPVSFERARISGMFGLGSSFNSGVNASLLVVEQSLLVKKCAFPAPSADLILTGASIKEWLKFEEATFEGSVDLTLCQIGKSFFVHECNFKNKSIVSLSLLKAHIAGLVIKNSRWNGSLSCDSLTVDGDVILRGSHFDGYQGSLSFVLADVKGHVLLEHCVSSSLLDVTRATIGGNFRICDSFLINLDAAFADGRKLLSLIPLGGVTSIAAEAMQVQWDKGASWNLDEESIQTNRPAAVVLYQLKIGGTLELCHTSLWGDASAADMVIGGHILLHATVFLGSSGCDLTRLRCGGGIRMETVAIQSDFSVSGARVGGDVSFYNLTIDAAANMFRMDGSVIEGNFLIESSYINCVATLSDIAVGEWINFARCTFLGENSFDLFNSAVKKNVAISNCEFFSGFNAADIMIGTYFSIEDCNFNKGMILRGTSVGANFLFQSMYAKHGDFSGIACEGDGVFDQIMFDGLVNFDSSRFKNLSFFNVQWKGSSAPQWSFGSLAYDSLAIDSERPDLNAQLRLLASAKFCRPMYLSLEDSWKKEGNRECANEAFFAGKRRERSSFAPLDWAMDYFTGYGRKWWNFAIWAGITFLVGAVAFRKRFMESSSLSSPYNSVWYSLALFIPLDNASITQEWRPKHEWRPKQRKFYRILWHYHFAHQYLGWVFLTVAVAAIVSKLGQ